MRSFPHMQATVLRLSKHWLLLVVFWQTDGSLGTVCCKRLRSVLMLVWKCGRRWTSCTRTASRTWVRLLLSCQTMHMCYHSAEVWLSLTAVLASPLASHADTAACHSHASAPQAWSGYMKPFSARACLDEK